MRGQEQCCIQGRLWNDRIQLYSSMSTCPFLCIYKRTKNRKFEFSFQLLFQRGSDKQLLSQLSLSLRLQSNTGLMTMSGGWIGDSNVDQNCQRCPNRWFFFSLSFFLKHLFTDQLSSWGHETFYFLLQTSCKSCCKALKEWKSRKQDSKLLMTITELPSHTNRSL